jgi:hypothetical protein
MVAPDDWSYQRGQLTLSAWKASGCSLLSLRTACGSTKVRAITSNTIKKPQSLGAFLEIRAHLLGAAFTRGESRRCKGSIEPLLKLPDGALATRRIVSLLGALLRRRRAAQACGSKGVQLSQAV